MIACDYLAPMGVEHRVFARWCGIGEARFEMIACGKASLAVHEAIRIARALDLNADRIVQMQTKFDLAVARADAANATISPIPTPASFVFPTRNVVRGSLAEISDSAYEGYCWFLRENAPATNGYDDLRELVRGDVLRVYDADGDVLYVGTVLKDLEGRMLLPHATFAQWSPWFFQRHRADLALGGGI